MTVVGTYGFSPTLTYGSPSTTITLERPRSIEIAVERVGSDVISWSGSRVVQSKRNEIQVTISWERIKGSTLTALRTYFDTWGSMGKQATLILDTRDKAAGYWEYDQFNRYFTKAELVTSDFNTVAGRMRKPPLHDLSLTFRQGI